MGETPFILNWELGIENYEKSRFPALIIKYDAAALDYTAPGLE